MRGSKRDPKAESERLHRAKRKKELKWRDDILCLVDDKLGEGLALIDAVTAARKAGVRLQREENMLDSAARRIHISRLCLRNYLFEFDPD